MSISLLVCLSFFLVGIALILTNEFIETKRYRYSVLAIVLIVFITSTYESLLAVYLCGVFAILILKFMFGDEEDKSCKKIFLTIVKSTIILGLGVMLELIITKMYIYILGLKAYGANSVLWNFKDIQGSLEHLFKSNVEQFAISCLSYLPIVVFLGTLLLAMFLGVRSSVKTKKYLVLLLYIGIIGTTFILTIIQGTASPWRTCQVYSFFVAFVIMIGINDLLQSKVIKIIKGIGLFLVCLLILQQANDLNKWFYVDYMRYQEDLVVVNDVGLELQKNYDLKKPIYFIGRRPASQNIAQHTTVQEGSLEYKFLEAITNKSATVLKNMNLKYVQTNGISFFKTTGIIGIHNSVVSEMFNKEGFYLNQGTEGAFTKALTYQDISPASSKEGTVEDYQEALRLGKEMPFYPYEGYILETQEFIIVRLGEYDV